VPAYRKTKDVDLKKMKADTAEELEYQKSYARRRSHETARDESAGRIGPKQARRQQASYERVNPELKPKKRNKLVGGAEDLLNSVRAFLERAKEGHQRFKDIPTEMENRKR